MRRDTRVCAKYPQRDIDRDKAGTFVEVRIVMVLGRQKFVFFTTFATPEICIALCACVLSAQRDKYRHPHKTQLDAALAAETLIPIGNPAFTAVTLR